MEVNKDEVEVTHYQINSADWKVEEKREHYDSDGRMWSAPSIINGNPKEDAEVTIQRRYHRAGEILAKQMTAAGEYLGIRIPLAGEYMIGQSWADTH